MGLNKSERVQSEFVLDSRIFPFVSLVMAKEPYKYILLHLNYFGELEQSSKSESALLYSTVFDSRMFLISLVVRRNE